MRAAYQAERTVSELEHVIEKVRRSLDPGHFATVEAAALRLVELDAARAGTKPLFCLVDDQQRRFALKLAPAELMAAEQAAYELRRLGARPCVPARVVELELPEQGQVKGLLKPFLDFDVQRELSADTREWSELQRNAVLLDHAWEWLLDNLDTNTSQYALLGEAGYPLNIDWDRSFATGAQSALSRFEKYRIVLPNARTFLYSDYVEGKIDLPLSLLHAEAHRLRRLPAASVRAIVERYARVRYEDDRERASFVRRVLHRQRRIEADFKRFARDLLRERLAITVVPDPGLRGRFRQSLTLLWDRAQVLMHRIARGSLGTAARKLLRTVRTKLWFQPARHGP